MYIYISIICNDIYVCIYIHYTYIASKTWDARTNSADLTSTKGHMMAKDWDVTTNKMGI